MSTDSPSTTDRLAEIAARAAATAYFTPPWRFEDDEFGTDINFGPHYQIEDAAGDLVAVVEDESIRNLVLHARDDIEHLLSLVDSLQEHLDTAEGQLAKVRDFVHARHEFVRVLRQYSTEDMSDYHRWTGHAEARRELAETLGLELDSKSGGLAERTTADSDAPPVMVYGASDDLIEVRGAVDDELGANYNKPSTIVVKTASGQTVWLCTEYDPDGSGEWRVYPVSGHGRVLRDGHELVTIIPARGEDAGDDEDGCPGYSDKAIVKGGISVEVKGDGS